MSLRKKHVRTRVRKIKPRKSILKSSWFWLATLILAIIFASVYFLIFYSGVQVENIVISGNQKIAVVDIENLIFENISNNFSKSIFLVNSASLMNQILSKFPLINSAKVNKEFLQTLRVKVSERIPVAMFCQTNKEDCYFIDNDGVAFEQALGELQDIVIVRQITGGMQISIGSRVIEQEIIDLVLKIQKNLKDNFQIDLKETIVKNSSRMDVATGESWKIYFDLSRDTSIDSQLAKLNLLLSNEIPESNRGNLRYIDLRPKDRAVVCDNSTCGM